MTTTGQPVLDPSSHVRSVIITVSGTILPDRQRETAEGRRPRADYEELASAVSGQLLDHGSVNRPDGRLARTLARLLGPDVALAWACFRRRNDVAVVFTDSERVGMIYAALSLVARRRPRHVMIGHRLSAPKKVRMHRMLGLRRRIDHVVVYSSSQRKFAIDKLGYTAEQVTLTPFMVDTAFWQREGLPREHHERPIVCAAGQELRDYPTLIACAREIAAEVVIAADSPWSKRADSSVGVEIPSNVRISRLHPYDLRQLYAEADIVVVPLEETDFQAGITTILEAMSMGVAVICSRTVGQTDAIVEGETGRYVPPGDVSVLSATITELLGDAEQRNRLATAGQRWAREHADIARYTATLASTIDNAAR